MIQATFSRAVLMAAMLGLMSVNAQAADTFPGVTLANGEAVPTATITQVAAPAVAPDAATGSSFSGYRVLAVTAGLIGGAVVAGIVTDGLIIPLYCWATGATGTGAGAGAAAAGARVAGMGARAGAGAGAGATAAGAAVRTGAGSGMNAFRGVMRTLGAVGGGFYGDSLYQGRTQ